MTPAQIDAALTIVFKALIRAPGDAGLRAEYIRLLGLSYTF